MSGPPHLRNPAGGSNDPVGIWDDSAVPLLIALLIGIAMLGGAIAAGLPPDRDPRRAAAVTATTATGPQSAVTPEPIERVVVAVTNAGDGRGTVRVDGDRRDCSDTCNFELEAGGDVTIVARPRDGSRFAGWTDPCDILRTCTLSLDRDRSIIALFDRAPPAAATDCNDEFDNDGDDLIDADDLDCERGDSEDPPAPPARTPVPVIPPPVVAPPPPPPIAPPPVAPPPPPVAPPPVAPPPVAPPPVAPQPVVPPPTTTG